MSFLVADSTTDERYLRQTVELHLASLPELFLSRLGRYFVARFYDEIRSDGGSLLGLWLEEDRVVGVAAGGYDLGQVFHRIGFYRLSFALEMLKSVSRSPGLIIQLFRSLGGVEKKNCQEVELTYFAVAPDMRGRGIGKELVYHYGKWWSKRGYSQLSLYVESENEGALRFYRREGFVPVKEVSHGAYKRWYLRRPN